MKTLLLALVVLIPLPLAAQGLGGTAARERQKRETKKPSPPARVYSNQDLPAEEARPAEGAEGAVVPADAAAPAPEGSAGAGASPQVDPSSPAAAGAPRDDAAADPLEKERQQRKLLEAEWRVRFANAREELATAEAESWREVVRTEFYQGIPVQMRVKEQVETDELKQARKALADLEEEFRRTGLPPGWARE